MFTVAMANILRNIRLTGNRLNRTKLICLLILTGSTMGWAQESDVPDYSLRNPYQTIRTHLGNLQSESYYPEIAAKTFPEKILTEEEAIEKAIKLKQVLDGAGIYINLDEVPREEDYYDTAANRHRYYLTTRFPEVYVVKSKETGLWQYSPQTVEIIDKLHNEVYPFGADVLLELLPKLGQQKFWGLYIWQHIFILILIILSFSIYKILNYIFERLISQILSRAGYKDIARNFIVPIAKPFSMLVIFLLLMFAVPLIQLPANVAQYIIKGLRGIWPVFATAIFYRLVDILGIYLDQVAKKTESTLDDQLVPLVRKSLKAFVVVIGGLFILQNLEFDVTALIAGLSIGGLAFALAAQDTIKNFFGSLMIFVDKPFQIGDWVTSGEIDGTVEEVGFRSTRIRTFRNSVTYVPNGKLADAVIDNHGLRQYRRFYTQIRIAYDTPPDLIELFVQGLRQVIENHPHTRKDYYNIYLNDFAPYSLNVMLYIFFAVPTWPEELRGRHEVIIEVIKLAERLGVRFALPTQTLHMKEFPGQPSLMPEYEQDMDKLKKEMESFLKNQKN